MIMLSFDAEEFDLPREHGIDIPLADAVAISAQGMQRVLDVLQQCGVPATFFTTVRFAQGAPGIVERMVGDGHEVASHSVDHSAFRPGDVERSRVMLEQLCQCPVVGYRQPRMQHVDPEQLRQAGYRYNASMHPTWIPGRYNHLREPRLPHAEGHIVQMPSSVTPWLRLPLFWLACHHYPQWLYLWLADRTLAHDGSLLLYFHPWEFVDLSALPQWQVPYLVRRNSGSTMERRLRTLIARLARRDSRFVTITQFCDASGL